MAEGIGRIAANPFRPTRRGTEDAMVEMMLWWKLLIVRLHEADGRASPQTATVVQEEVADEEPALPMGKLKKISTWGSGDPTQCRTMPGQISLCDDPIPFEERTTGGPGYE